MKVREVYCDRFWLLNKKWFGITLYPFIFYNRKHWHIQSYMRKHEWVHIAQIRRVGWFKFYATYIYYNITLGYDNNPYEVEAYSKQADSAQH